MNYAVLWVEDFALHALRRSEPGLAGKPVALVAGEGRKAVLTEISPEATGIERGCAVTLAMARCPGIVLRTREAGPESEAQRILHAAGFTLAPRVEATGLGWCTVDLQGAELGRVEATLRRQVAELARMGLPAKGGVGSTPLLASYAARAAESVGIVSDTRQFLRELPLAVAEPSGQQAEILRGWGIRTLGELTALAKADLGERLGPGGVALWERAAGGATRPLRMVELARSFAAAWNYDPPIDMLAPLAFKLQRFAERIAMELMAAGFVAEKLTLTLFLEDGKEHGREFRLPEPGADAASWMRVLLAHLATVKLAARLERARLVAGHARPQEKEDGLFDSGLRDPAAFWENLARLGALVGDDRVGTPVLLDTNRPDAFVLERPAETVPAPEEPPAHPPRGLALRRFRPGWRVTVRLSGNRPAGLSGRFSGDVRAAHGPWRAEGEWWRPDAWAVEVWLVELEDGAAYQLACQQGGWCVEGVFD